MVLAQSSYTFPGATETLDSMPDMNISDQALNQAGSMCRHLKSTAQRAHKRSVTRPLR